MKLPVARDALRCNLVFLRAQLRLSQAAVAERAEISRPFVSEIEQGRANVSLDVLDRLAGALEVTAAQLLEPTRVGSADADIARRAADGDDAFVDAHDLLAALDNQPPGSTGSRYSKRGRKPAVSR